MEESAALSHAVRVVCLTRVHARVLREHLGDVQVRFVVQARDLEVARWLDLKALAEPRDLGCRESSEIGLESVKELLDTCIVIRNLGCYLCTKLKLLVFSNQFLLE